MEKLNLAKQYKSYYSAKNKPELVEIEEVYFLSITGKGDPSEKQFADKIQALYATAYTIKFMCKDRNKDFVVAKLEGLWHFDEQKYGHVSITDAPVKVPRSEWEYRMMIRIPEFVTKEVLADAIQQVISKKQLALANEIELYHMKESKAVQMLHIGPFENEPETLDQMRVFIKTNNLHKNGLHHEIYLNDFNRTPPDKLKTILREPVK